LIGGFRQIH